MENKVMSFNHKFKEKYFNQQKIKNLIQVIILMKILQSNKIQN